MFQTRCAAGAAKFTFFSIPLLLLVVLKADFVLAQKPILEIDPGGHKAIIRDVLFTNDGRYLVSASDDKTVRVWDVEMGEIIRVFRGQMGEGQDGKIYAAALSPDNAILAVAGYPAEWGIRLIDFATGEVLKVLKGHGNVINGLAFSPDGICLASASADKTARIWEINTGRTRLILKGHEQTLYTVAFSPDGTRVVTGSVDHNLKMWDARSGALTATLKGHKDKVYSAAFTPDGRYLLTGGRDKTIRLWDGTTGESIKVLAELNRAIWDLSVSPDSQSVLAGIGDYGSGRTDPQVFSIPSGERLTVFNQHENNVLATAISPDGSTAATGGGNDQEIFLWDLKTGRVKHKLVGRGKPVWGVGFAKDGRSIAWGNTDPCPGQMCLPTSALLEKSFFLKKVDGKPDLQPGKSPIQDSDFIRNAATAGSWSVHTPNKKVHPTLETRFKGIAAQKITRDAVTGLDHRSFTLTPDGKSVISGGSNGFLTSYDPRTGKVLHDFIGHTGDVYALAVSPDGQRLVSGSLDQTLRLWDIANGKLLLSLFYGTDNEWVAWTPEGFYDASPKGDQYVGWRVNRGADKAADFYTVSQFRRYLYRPDIVRDTLAMGSSEQAIQKAGMEQITVEDLIERAPVDVSIASTKVDPSGKADISVRLGKNKTTLPERVTIYVNGAQILSANQRRLSGVEAGDTLHYQTQLSEKENHIRVTVENKWAENSDERWVENPTLDKQPPVAGTLYVHGIGVSRYPNLEEHQQLYSPPLDAKNIAGRFKKLEGRLYEKVVVNLLTDENGKLVTTPKIESFLNRNVVKAGPEDATIIFLAGHGITDDKGNYQFITADTKVVTGKDGEMVPKLGTSFDWTRLHKILDRTRGKRLVIVDTCQAGKVLHATKTDIRKLVKDIHDVNAIIHTGTSRQQIGLESPEGGVFTQSILAGLDGKAEYKDGRLLFVSLQKFVAEETPKRNIANIKRMFSRGLLIVQKKPGEGEDKKESEMTFDTTQHPVAVIPKGMEGFVISRE